jgi:hypothetical protein
MTALMLFLLCFDITTSEIELTFSNEDENEQNFIVKTENQVQSSALDGSSLGENQDKDVSNGAGLSESSGSSGSDVITMLIIMKGEVLLLEKTTAEIGRDGYDMDIDSDLLDTGENVLDLLLLSANGTVIQQEKITVFSPPLSSAPDSSPTATDPSFGMKYGSMTRTASAVLRRQYESLCSQMQAILNNEDQCARLVTATCGTVGVATCGAFLYSQRRRAFDPPASTSHLQICDQQQCDVDIKSKKKYISKFPRYPIPAALTPVDFTSPKMMSKMPAASTSLVANVKDLVLGRSNKPRSFTLVVQGGVALLGARAAKALISKAANRHEKDNRPGGIFRIGQTKVRQRRRWSLGRFFQKP